MRNFIFLLLCLGLVACSKDPYAKIEPLKRPSKPLHKDLIVTVKDNSETPKETVVLKAGDEDPKLPKDVEEEIKQLAGAKDIPKADSFIFLGSFKEAINLDSMLNKLTHDGYAPRTHVLKSGLVSVALGPFPKKQAKQIKDILLEKGYPEDMYVQ